MWVIDGLIFVYNLTKPLRFQKAILLYHLLVHPAKDFLSWATLMSYDVLHIQTVSFSVL